jgi:hypothetical protein
MKGALERGRDRLFHVITGNDRVVQFRYKCKKIILGKGPSIQVQKAKKHLNERVVQFRYKGKKSILRKGPSVQVQKQKKVSYASEDDEVALNYSQTL